jgi:hypothetical protein
MTTMPTKMERIGVHERDRTLPTSNRFLFYELEGKDDGYGILVSKVKTGARRPDQDLIDALTALREDGSIPWDYIVDETRHVEMVWRPNTVTEFLEACLDQAKIDPWQWKVERPVVLCESRSLAGVLRDLCRHYGVISASTNGQCAGFTRTKLAAALKEQSKQQNLLVLYCGDLDLGGGQIENNTQEVLFEAANRSIFWERLMLTDEQVKRHSLPSMLKTDRRFKHGGGTDEAWECEALSQKLIVELLEARLKKLLGSNSWGPRTIAQIEKTEKAERALIRITRRRKP